MRGIVFGVVGGLVALDDDRWGRSFVGAEYDCCRREEERIKVGAAVEAADISMVLFPINSLDIGEVVVEAISD